MKDFSLFYTEVVNVFFILQKKDMEQDVHFIYIHMHPCI